MKSRNKKLSALVVCAILASMVLTACGGGTSSSAPAPAPGGSSSSTAAPAGGDSSTAAPSGDVTMQTSDTNKVVTIGTLPVCEGPIYITSVGQSADASMLDALMKKIGAEYTFNSTAKAADVAGAKTVIIAAGASSKGLGAAGISADDEKARAKELLQTCKDNNITVIMAHLGGASRRGPLSDEFTNMVLDGSAYLMVVEDGNADGLFTTYAKDKNIPVTLLKSIADAMAPLQEIFPAK